MWGGGYAPPLAIRYYPGCAPGPGLALRLRIGLIREQVVRGNWCSSGAELSAELRLDLEGRPTDALQG